MVNYTSADCPPNGRYVIEVVFKSEEEKEFKRSEKQLYEWVFEPKRVVGINLGVDNLVTIIDNTGLKPVLIKGKWLKSVSQYYNKSSPKKLKRPVLSDEILAHFLLVFETMAKSVEQHDRVTKKN